jgi:hypothetical protein
VGTIILDFFVSNKSKDLQRLPTISATLKINGLPEEEGRWSILFREGERRTRPSEKPLSLSPSLKTIFNSISPSKKVSKAANNPPSTKATTKPKNSPPPRQHPNNHSKPPPKATSKESFDTHPQ